MTLPTTGVAGTSTTVTAGRAGVAAPSAGSGTSTAAAGKSAAGVSGSAGATLPVGPAGASGSTGGMSGSTAPAAGSGAGNPLDVGNSFASGAWHGYAWTSAQGMGSTIDPMDFSKQTTGMPRCVKGSVAATTDYSGIAMLGLNLNQDSGSSGAEMTVTPTKGGITIDVKNTGGSALRVQVQTPNGGMNADERWCAELSGSGGFIPWSMFNTKCWDGTGMAYAKQPISALMVVVPGMSAAAVPFDFCLNALAEADGPATGGTAGAGGSAPAAGSGAAAGGTAANAGAGGPTAGGSSTVPPLQGGCMGYATRYWDCCKPHCAWKGNVPAGSSPLATCDQSDNSLGGNFDAKSSCDGDGTAYMCHAMVPWSVNDQLAYGYAAVASSATDICGKCYQLQFTGVSFNAGEDPGSTALRGKTMIVQALNIGSDVANSQFDISIPGGGVGMFNACSKQWGVPASELGATYGGFLNQCKQEKGRTDHAALKSCVMQSCMNVFEARGLKELAAGCQWFVDWFQVADNPSVMYKEVACPAELANKGIKRNTAPANACLH